MGLPLDDIDAGGANRMRLGYANMVRTADGFDRIHQRTVSGDAALTKQIRDFIPTVHRTTVGGTTDQRPFDEPTLGLVGMWTLGGGANPHFAMALGHLMESVQQRRIAWDAVSVRPSSSADQPGLLACRTAAIEAGVIAARSCFRPRRWSSRRGVTAAR